jgi:nucleotide-binding universal stress UspA family protein
VTTNAHGPVVVGIDMSGESRRAARYGAWEARRRRVPLRLVGAHAVALRQPAQVLFDGDLVRAMLGTVEKEIAADHPDLHIDTATIMGTAAGVLVAESRSASLVVIGTRATGGLLGHVSGSVAAQVAAHSDAPVVVLRPTAFADDDPAAFDGRPVVVGMDGSVESEKAMTFAVDQAIARHAAVHAVYVWNILAVHGIGPIVAEMYINSDEAAKATRLLTEATAGWSDRYPDLTITRHPVHDMDPITALVRAGDGAGLIVVGSRGHGGFLGLRLGSTVDGLIRYATTSVAVIRGEQSDPR